MSTLLRTRWTIASAVALAFLGALIPNAAEAGPRARTRLRAMTFNIRFDFPNDGQNGWSHRVDTVAKVIRESQSYVVCIQEDKEDQVSDLQQRLAGWEFHGRGRNANGS